MRRVVAHWTAGTYTATGFDRVHYHVLIDGNGQIVRGSKSICANAIAGSQQVAHIRGRNTGSIGVAVCCMAGAQQVPFRPGKYPMTETQFERMADVIAQLCRRYNIPISPESVFGHGEVQAGKWDPMVLPWSPQMPAASVGNYLRDRVQYYYEHTTEAINSAYRGVTH